MALTPQQHDFIRNYLRGRGKEESAILCGCPPAGARTTAWKWLKKPEIKREIERRIAKRDEQAVMSQAEVLRQIRDRAHADVRDLIELHIDCCRFCHGVDHDYQETRAERKRRQEAHQTLLKATPESQWAALPQFNTLGGIGFDPRKPPHPDCPECHGRGIHTVIPRDTRTLNDGAAMIYEGVKVTKDGFELKIGDRLKPLEMAGRFHAMFGDKRPPEAPATEGQGMRMIGVKPPPTDE